MVVSPADMSGNQHTSCFRNLYHTGPTESLLRPLGSVIRTSKFEDMFNNNRKTDKFIRGSILSESISEISTLRAACRDACSERAQQCLFARPFYHPSFAIRQVYRSTYPFDDLKNGVLSHTISGRGHPADAYIMADDMTPLTSMYIIVLISMGHSTVSPQCVRVPQLIPSQMFNAQSPPAERTIAVPLEPPYHSLCVLDRAERGEENARNALSADIQKTEEHWIE